MLKLRLAHKIAALGMIGVLGAVVLGIVYMRGAWSESAHLAEANRARAVADLGNKTIVELLQSRRAEKDFLLRSDEKYTRHHADLTKSILAHLTTLEEMTGAGDESELSENITAVRKGFETYAKHFGAVAEHRGRLGLDENSGLESALRKSVQSAEAALKELDEPRLTTLVLMMRRHEKDFMLRRDAKYGEEMRKRADEFAAALAASSLSEADKQSIGQKIADYQRDYFAWMAEADAMAAEQKAASDAFSSIEPALDTLEQLVDKIGSEAGAAYEASKAATELAMKSTIVAVVLIAALLSYVIGRGISRPLQNMTAVMRKLASGDMTVEIPGAGRGDEIGDMAGAVLVFRDNMAEAERLRAEQASSEKRAAAERKAEMQKIADQFKNTVGGIVETVSAASSQLESAAGALTQTAETTQQLSGVVAAASEETSVNVQGVAAASEQLSATVSEISRQVQESSTISGQAVTQAVRTNDRVTELSQSADRIGDVIGLINTIAGQTNLLALNATI
ncbi:MAG TPA: methyl-accepting chemotaxis protein, partial [Hyphomicrobium sp.]|nr:methyl-accepting chemotaxis protein [Hyphomicrobium sp.]